MVPLLQISSPLLRQHNTEIFVSSLASQNVIPEISEEVHHLRQTALVPMVATPGSFAGNVSMVRHPVHRTFIVANGILGCVGLAPWVRCADNATRLSSSMIHMGVNMPAMRDEQEETGSRSDMTVLHLPLADAALSSFRASHENGVSFEQGWHKSGMPEVIEWLNNSAKTMSKTDLRLAIADTIEEVIEETGVNVAKEEKSKIQDPSNSIIPEHLKESLENAIANWAFRGHTELRNRLDAAFAGRLWAKIKWWKLFWRVDDVTMIVDDLLERKWLIRAEKGVFWLAGRFQEVGISKEDLNIVFDDKDVHLTMARTTGVPPSSSARLVLDSEEHMVAKRWPMLIPRERSRIQEQTTSILQTLAQRLVFQTLSLTGFSSALSTLLYLSFSSWTIYEAGAVASFGLVGSLFRMQNLWEDARSSWQAELEERGRIALRLTEEIMKAKVTEARRHREQDTYGVHDRKKAREAIENARMAFQTLAENREGRHASHT